MFLLVLSSPWLPYSAYFDIDVVINRSWQLSPKNDKIYSRRQKQVRDFAFDKKVVAVFPDMINRSVPGYRMIVEMIGMLAARRLQKDDLCYDLGCSLGAVSLSILEQLSQVNCRIKAIDNSPAMIENLQKLLQSLPGGQIVEPQLADIEQLRFEKAAVMVMNFTLQFIAPQRRLQLLKDIHAALAPEGFLILAEKIDFEDHEEHDFQIAAHHGFKRSNGYSELEISQKRTALEKVMIPDSIETHTQRCRDAGFGYVYRWFQCFNFIALIAGK